MKTHLFSSTYPCLNKGPGAAQVAFRYNARHLLFRFVDGDEDDRAELLA